MVPIQEPGRDERPEILIDDEDHDGWGPIRPRRTTTPPALHAEQDEATIPVLCTPVPDGLPDKR